MICVILFSIAHILSLQDVTIRSMFCALFTYIPPLINQILLTALQLPTSICLAGSSILASSFACWSIGILVLTKLNEFEQHVDDHHFVRVL